MTELFIKNKFIQFLKSDKNFPDDSFLLNYHYVDKGGIIYVDLAILDTKTNKSFNAYKLKYKKNHSTKKKLIYDTCCAFRDLKKKDCSFD